MVKVSVVMPVYNQKEEFLREAIESILNQTFTDYELIIINDGSTNNSEEVILSYSDDRIVYIKQENQGVARSLNNGIEIANGEYIARMDSDDISLPERFEKQIKFLDEHPEISILGTSYEIIPRNKTVIQQSVIKYTDILNACCVCHPSVMMRKADLDKYNLRYNPEFTSEDYELWSRAVQYLNIQNLPEVLVKYRWHEENISHQAAIFEDSDKRIKERMLNFLTGDINFQEKILYHTAIEKIQYKPSEKIFSMKNFKVGNEKYKAVTIFGKSIYLAK